MESLYEQLNYNEENNFNNNIEFYRLITRAKTFNDYKKIRDEIQRNEIYNNITSKKSFTINIKENESLKFQIDKNNIQICFDKDIFTLKSKGEPDYYMIIKYALPECLNEISKPYCNLPEIYINDMKEMRHRILHSFGINDNVIVYISKKYTHLYNVSYTDNIDKQIKNLALEGYPIDINNIYVDSLNNIYIIDEKGNPVEEVEEDNKKYIQKYTEIHNFFMENICNVDINDNDFTCTGDKCIIKNNESPKKQKSFFSFNLFKRSKSNTDEKELEEEPKEEEEPKPAEEEKCSDNYKCFKKGIITYISNFIESPSVDSQLENKIESYFKDIPRKKGFFSSKTEEYIKAEEINKWFNDWKENTCNIIYLRELVELLNDKELEKKVEDNEEKIFNNNCKSVFIKLYATEDDINNKLNNCNKNNNCHEIISELKNLTIKLYNENDIKKDCECNEKCAEKYFKTHDLEGRINEYKEKLTEMENLEKQQEEKEARMKESSEKLNNIVNELKDLENNYNIYIGRIEELNEKNISKEQEDIDLYNKIIAELENLKSKYNENDISEESNEYSN